MWFMSDIGLGGGCIKSISTISESWSDFLFLLWLSHEEAPCSKDCLARYIGSYSINWATNPSLGLIHALLSLTYLYASL